MNFTYLKKNDLALMGKNADQIQQKIYFQFAKNWNKFSETIPRDRTRLVLCPALTAHLFIALFIRKNNSHGLYKKLILGVTK